VMTILDVMVVWKDVAPVDDGGGVVTETKAFAVTLRLVGLEPGLGLDSDETEDGLDVTVEDLEEGIVVEEEWVEVLDGVTEGVVVDEEVIELLDMLEDEEEL
jgi:hypothetical protein